MRSYILLGREGSFLKVLGFSSGGLRLNLRSRFDVNFFIKWSCNAALYIAVVLVYGAFCLEREFFGFIIQTVKSIATEKNVV